MPNGAFRKRSQVKSRPENEEHEEQIRISSWSQAFVDILPDIRLEDNIVGKKTKIKESCG